MQTPTKYNIPQYSIGKQIDLAIGDGPLAVAASTFFSVKDFNPGYDPKVIGIEDAEGNRSTHSFNVIGDKEYKFTFAGTTDVNKIGKFIYLATGTVVSAQDSSTGAYQHVFAMLNNVVLPKFTLFFIMGAEGYRRLTNCVISKLTIDVKDAEAVFTVEGMATGEDSVLNSTNIINSLIANSFVYQSGDLASQGSIIRVTLTNSSVKAATAAALPANTYSNGTAGVGATLTATGNGVLTVDGQAIALNDLVLVKNEVTTANNGVYKCTTAGTSGVPYVLTRDTGFDTSAELLVTYVRAASGTVNGNVSFAIVNTSAITIGTTAITFAVATVNVNDVLQIPSSVTGITNSDNKGSFLIVASSITSATVMTIDIINNARYDASHDETSITSSIISVTNITAPSYPVPVSIMLRRHAAVFDAADVSSLSSATAAGLRNFTIEINHNSAYVWEKPKSADPLETLAHNITTSAKFTQIISYNSAQKAINSRTLAANNRAWRFELEDTGTLLGTSSTYHPLIQVTMPQTLGVGTRAGAGKNDELTYDWNLNTSEEQATQIVLRNTTASYP